MDKRTILKTWPAISIFLVALATGAAAPGRIIYVDDDATGANDGSSWSDGYNYLQDALADANSADKPTEIRVAQGIYRPNQGILAIPDFDWRTATFQLINGVSLKGGYAGLGEPDPNARDIELYETILTGDLNGDDVEVVDPRDLLSHPSRADNSYHVVTGSGIDETAVLDGFTITAGNDNRYNRHRLLRPLGYGGGMCNNTGMPTVTNCTFSANSASRSGGGMYNGGSNPILSNCIFRGNSASGKGGGIYNWSSKPILIGCTFNGNFADDGGGLYNIENSYPSLTNCTFWGNDNCAVSSSEDSNSRLINCIVWGNTGGQIGGTAIVLYSDVEGGFAGEANINADPCFADTNDGDYHLKSQAGRWDPNSRGWVQDDVTSPCIDSGDLASPISIEPFPNGGVINMGAYGGTAEASKSWFGKPVCEMHIPGDLNSDCVVDQLDMAIIAFHWLEDAVGGGEPTSALAYPGSDGELVYATYRNVGDDISLNILPDWSKCGYMGGGVKIPDIPVRKIVNPMDGDDGARIQAAIDYVSGLPFDSNGFRGAVLLKKGTYEVEGTIFITASGVVLRGQGQSPDGGTRIIDTGQQQDTLISVKGRSRTEFPGTRTRITESFVPVGVKSFRVQSATGFSVGEHIIVHRQTNQKWIDDLVMAKYWNNKSYYEDVWERVITAIDGDRVAIRAPIVQAIEEQYGGGSIFKYSSERRISNVGVECLWLESEYDYDYDKGDDETHGWNAVELRNVENAWVRQVTSRYFGYACVNTKRGTKNVTIQDCACLDPKSKTTGMRKYSFPIDDCCFVLVQRCFTRGGRHDYITGSRVPGPNAFVDCLAIECYSDSGNHHRYAEGTLFDNVKAAELAVENRNGSGTGHGWSGAQTLFWNCEARTKCHAPLGAMNWAIGLVGEMRLGSWFPDDPLGYWEAHGTHVTPRSLYYKQLEDRLGYEAVENVTIPAQRTGTIWNQLNTWAGVGRMESVSLSGDNGLMGQAQALPGGIEAEDHDMGKAGFAYGRKERRSGPNCEFRPKRIAGDINEDCKVNFEDFAIMALHWLEDR